MRNEIAKSKLLPRFEGEEFEHDTEGAKPANDSEQGSDLVRLLLVRSAWRNVPLISQILCCQKLGNGKTQLQMKTLLHFLMKPIKVDRRDFLSEHGLLSIMIKC